VNRIPTAGEALVKALSDSDPLVLLLGQDDLKENASATAALHAILNHVGVEAAATSNWRDIQRAMPLPETFFQWLAERYARTVPAKWVSNVVGLPWSAVFTSSFDQTLSSVFRSSSRQPQAVLTSDEAPPAARSLSRTPIYYLFGRAGNSDSRALAPCTQSQLRVRRTLHAVPMLNRIVDAATAVGLVVIDGYAPGADWLDVDSLLATIDRLPEQRVLWFGWTPDGKTFPEELLELVTEGKVLVEPLRLGAYLAQLEVSGRMSNLTPHRSGESGLISYAGDKRTIVPPELRIQVEAACVVVDDSWSGFQEPLGDDARYSAFVRFHGDVDGPRAMVEGIRRQFAITRDFEKTLNSLVLEGVDSHSRLRDPIVVHGQSATGKSVSLARLVINVRDELRAAVLYATARLPQAFEVSEFCELAERSGALSTVLICDCNVPISRYRELLQSLRSRGRRVVVVGSSYRIVDQARSLPREFVEASSELSLRERSGLHELVRGFSGNEAPPNVGANRSVLATLYRTLPSSRYRLASGLSSEARSVEQELRSRSTEIGDVELSPIAQQLISLGLAAQDTSKLEEGLLETVADADDSAGKLVDLAMAAGQLNCPIPINLLMRAVSNSQASSDLTKIARLFKGLDLFRWQESDTRGEDLLVSPRLTLEAELLCRRRLLGADAEAQQLLALIRAARSTWDYAGSERKFLIDLVQKMGPDGPMKSRYRSAYVEVARALTQLRTEGGIEDPRLALQESVLRRSAIRENAVTGESISGLLEEARDAVQSAIDSQTKRGGRGSSRAKANLIVERATIFGFLAVHESKSQSNPEKVWSAYRAARTAAQAAIGTTDAYNPFDVALWTPADLLREGGLEDSKKLELHADMQSVLDRVDPETLPIDQRERFYSRLHALGGLLELPTLTELALRALDAEGSAAGVFLRSRQVGPGYNKANVDNPDRGSASAAAAILEASWNTTVRDERCLRYLLSCQWISATGQWPLRGERRAIPATTETRRTVLRTIQALRDLGVSERDHGLVYLEAVLSWLGADENLAIRTWRELSRETEFSDSRRVVRRLILTDDSGRPQLFEGRVEAETEPGRFLVWAEPLNRRVQVLGRDFPGLELAYGRTIPRFGIAFNYIGPIADPLQHEALQL
jgi:hypothetical protein